MHLASHALPTLLGLDGQALLVSSLIGEKRAPKSAEMESAPFFCLQGCCREWGSMFFLALLFL
jgi:hypothetical protein